MSNLEPYGRAQLLKLTFGLLGVDPTTSPANFPEWKWVSVGWKDGGNILRQHMAPGVQEVVWGVTDNTVPYRTASTGAHTFVNVPTDTPQFVILADTSAVLGNNIATRACMTAPYNTQGDTVTIPIGQLRAFVGDKFGAAGAGFANYYRYIIGRFITKRQMPLLPERYLGQQYVGAYPILFDGHEAVAASGKRRFQLRLCSDEIGQVEINAGGYTGGTNLWETTGAQQAYFAYSEAPVGQVYNMLGVTFPVVAGGGYTVRSIAVINWFSNGAVWDTEPLQNLVCYATIPPQILVAGQQLRINSNALIFTGGI